MFCYTSHILWPLLSGRRLATLRKIFWDFRKNSCPPAKEKLQLHKWWTSERSVTEMLFTYRNLVLLLVSGQSLAEVRIFESFVHVSVVCRSKTEHFHFTDYFGHVVYPELWHRTFLQACVVWHANCTFFGVLFSCLCDPLSWLFACSWPPQIKIFCMYVGQLRVNTRKTTAIDLHTPWNSHDPM